MPLADFLRSSLDLSPSLNTPAGKDIDARELMLSEMIPYTVHYDDQTVVCKEDSVIQVIKLDGLFFESLSADQIRQFERQRNTVLRSVANSNRGVYVHLIRKKVNQYPDGEGTTWFAKTFNQAWQQQYQRNAFFINEIYISIVRTPYRQGVPGLLDRGLAWINGQKLTKQTEKLEDLVKDVNDATQLIIQSLAAYGARKLTIQRHPHFNDEEVPALQARQAILKAQLSWAGFQKHHSHHPSYKARDVLDFLGEEISEIAGFLNYLINLEDGRVPLSTQRLDRLLATSWIDFKSVGQTMTVTNQDGSRAAAMLSMAEWPNRTSSRMLDEFLQQPVEFIITQSFFFTDRISAEHDLRQERRRISVNDHEGMSGADQDELLHGLEELTRGQSVNGLHHLSILVHVNVPKHSSVNKDPLQLRQQALSKLDHDVGLIKKAFVNLGVKPVREWFGLETFFWSQLPGQGQHFIGRRGKIKSSNFAGFASLHNFATGKIDGNLWGPAIMPFETESKTAYYFNFHREMDGMVAGHTTITADTGSGKTTLLSALIAMADKAKPRVFWFDNREGAKVFIKAMGGHHTTLTAQTSTGWNPFQLPDTTDNRLYLVELLTLMRTCYGGALIPEDVERFKNAVEENFLLPPADRRLRNLVWCFGQGELARDMRVWHGANGQDGANWGVFDNISDEIDLSVSRYQCFEMRQLIKDGVARPELPVILSYPFHRIEQAMNGEPFMLVLEEGQNLVKHAYWREKIDSYIMQIRRKNGLLIFITPDPKYLYCETDSIQKQAVTKLFLPNSAAKATDYVDALGLTPAEYEFIRDTPPEQRKFLIRRGNESIKASFDLGGLSHFIPVLSSNDKAVRLMETLIHQLGTDNPETWVPVFMEEALKQNTHNLTARE